MKGSFSALVIIVSMLLTLIYPLVSEAQDRYVFLNAYPEGPGLDGPYDLAVDSSGFIYVVDTNNNRVQKFNKYGDLLSSWGAWGTGNGNLYSPRGIAVDKFGDIYVADTDNNRIQKFSSSGAFLAKWGKKGVGNGEFTRPNSITVDNAGNIYVSDTDNNRIQKLDSNGNFITSWGTNGSEDGQFKFPEGIAVDSSGNVYVADVQNGRVQKFNSNGTFLKKLGKLGFNDGEFLYPRSIAVDSSGNIYVTDGSNDTSLPSGFRKNRVQKFDSEGKFIEKYGDNAGSGDGQFLTPRGIDISPSDDICVADWGNNRIQVLDSSGLFLAKWGIAGSGDGQFLSPKGVVLDNFGNIYVADTNNHRIQKLNPGGNYLMKWGGRGSADGLFIYPSGIAIDRNSGSIYVTDLGNNRIQKFDSSGAFLKKWGAMGSLDGQFMSPFGIAVDVNGNVYVADWFNNRIQKFDSNGNFILKWGALGGRDGEFDSPRGVATDQFGNVYVADTNNYRLQKFNSDGIFLKKWGGAGSGDSQFMTPWCIATDPNGNVYVSDYNHRIQKFDSNGNFIAKLGSEGDPMALLRYPNGMAIDISGNVYVADSGDQCIKLYARSAGNTPPTANPKFIATFEDTPIQFILTGRDPDGDVISFRITSQPTYGSLTGSPPNMTYTPNPEFSGSDSFAFVVSDGRVESKSASIQISVSAVNDLPTANSISLETDEDTPLDITLTGNDIEKDPLTFKIVDQPKNGVLTGDSPKFTYTPKAEFSGTDSFTFVANDGALDSAIATVNITIKMINDPPTANSGTAKVDEDNPVQLILTGSDPENGSITFSIVSQPSNGTLSGAPPNLTYTPKPNFFGTDSFTFTANDGVSTSQPATFSFTVNSVNDAPVATSTSATTKEDTSAKINLSVTDVENDPLTFKIIDFTKHGKMQFISAQQVIYVPDKDYNGTDSFTYTAKDATDESNTATVTITIESVNDPPIANPQTVKTPEDTPIKITLAGSDVDSEVLTFKLLNNPTNGTLDGTAPELNYTPNPNFFGEDSFTFNISDGFLDSNTATIKITVDPVNDLPTANPQSVTTNQDTTADIVLTGSDIESDPLTYRIVASPSHGFLIGDPPNLKYRPNDGFFGDDSFTFVANDRLLDSQPATVSIKVNKVNQSPFVSLISVSTDEDIPTKITLTGTDPNNDPLTFKIVSQPANGTLEGTSPDFLYTPKLNFNGNDSFTFIANDGEADSNVGTVSIIVKSVNSAPTPNTQSVSTDEDTPLKITLTASDPENDKLTFKIANQPLNGTLNGTPPIVTYTPNSESNGNDSFTFTANDGKLESSPAKVSITVKPINDPPVGVAQSVMIDEDTTVKITLTGTDPEDDKLTFKIIAQPSNGTLELNLPEVTYKPKENFNGSDSFTFIANDGILDSKPENVSIMVKPVNDPPAANEQFVTTDENVPVKITLSGSDLEKDAITFRVTAQPSNGTLSGAPPELTYEPKFGFGGDDSFTFIANDGKLDSLSATIKITINPMANRYDVNRDGIVNILDFVIVGAYFGKDIPKTGYNPDVNRDGKVDYQDIDVVQNNFGKKL